MIRRPSLLFALPLVAVGCTSGELAQPSYPETHPASAEAPSAPFIRPANVLVGEVAFPGIGREGDTPMSHSGMEHAMMDHGGPGSGMNHAAMGHGAAAGTSARAGTQVAQAGTAEVTGTGTIHSVNAGQRTINITHEPIPAIGWPAMTMDFPVAPSVDLSSIKPESRVTFTLTRGADGMYVIESLRPDGGAMPGMDHEQMDHGSMPGMEH